MFSSGEFHEWKFKGRVVERGNKRLMDTYGESSELQTSQPLLSPRGLFGVTSSWILFTAVAEESAFCITKDAELIPNMRAAQDLKGDVIFLAPTSRLDREAWSDMSHFGNYPSRPMIAVIVAVQSPTASTTASKVHH